MSRCIHRPNYFKFKFSVCLDSYRPITTVCDEVLYPGEKRSAEAENVELRFMYLGQITNDLKLD